MPKYTEKQLQEAIRHTQREPDVPNQRIAELYGVPHNTLRQRVLGTRQDRATAHRDEQLFSPGKEKAIAEYAGIMADAGFPLSPDLLCQIAQGIVNAREILQHGQGGIVGPHQSTFKPRDRRVEHLARQGVMLPSASNPNIHIVGLHWVNRFVDCNPGFRKVYVRYQERARAAASNDTELQDDFLRKLANLVRRKKIAQCNIWNCDKKGITMGKNSKRVMAIVRVGHKSTAMTEGSREFCSVLETVSAGGVIIPPFIVWQGKTHWESYYQEGGVEHEAIFAVSPSGYMDDELGLEYMQQHFEPYTRGAIRRAADGSRVEEVIEEVTEGAEVNPPPRCLIVDGHSSHISWQVVKFALDHNIHIICLPSKSTHLLQPLDVGCFSLLQTTYERNLSIWLRYNPLSAISKVDFLNILQQTREQVFTIEIIQSAWRASRCWPLNCHNIQPLAPAPAVSAAAAVSDTPARLRQLSREVEDMIRSELTADKRAIIHELIDLAAEKVTKYRDIAPRADTLKKL